MCLKSRLDVKLSRLLFSWNPSKLLNLKSYLLHLYKAATMRYGELRI